MKKFSLFLLTLLLVGGCGRSGSSPSESAPNGRVVTNPPGSSAQTPSATPATVFHDWQNADGTISLQYPSSLIPTQNFPGTYFTPEGWRAMFDGAPPGPGEGLIRFTATSLREEDNLRSATDILQIGSSDDPAVVADCLNSGLQGGSGMKQQDRLIGGVRFTAYSHDDASMSHRLSSLDLRAVRGGSCIAIDRMTLSVPAPVDASNPPEGLNSNVGRDLDAVLSSLTFK